MTGATFVASSPSLSKAWVVLWWKAKGVLQRNYRVEVALLDSQGSEVGETDKLLLSNERQPTSDWEAGQEEIDYYTLSSLPEMALD